MLAIHETLAHKKVDAMMDAFNAHFYHVDAAKAAAEVIDFCAKCQQLDPRPRDGRLGSDPTEWGRFEKVAFDVFDVRGAGPFQHGLLTIDINTGVVEITPMRGHTAADVEKALEDGWLRKWPTPKAWQSDNAQELIGTAMQKLETRYGIRRERIAAKNPQANGVAERAIGLFKRALRAVTPPGGDWTEHVAEARWALMCATIRARGGKSPIELATGLAPKLKDVAPEQLEATRDAPAPSDVVKQGGRAVKKYQQEQLAQQLANVGRGECSAGGTSRAGAGDCGARPASRADAVAAGYGGLDRRAAVGQGVQV